MSIISSRTTRQLFSALALAGVLSAVLATASRARQPVDTAVQKVITVISEEQARAKADSETQIHKLHDRLRILPDQETLWGSVAQVMRDNEDGLPAMESRWIPKICCSWHWLRLNSEDRTAPVVERRNCPVPHRQRASVSSKRNFTMINAMTKFNVEMQTQMTAFNDRLKQISTTVAANAADADKEIHRQIGMLESNAQKAKVSLEAARADMGKWVDDSVSTVAGWKSKFDASMLSARADRSEHYAAAASEVALAGVAAAQKAMLDAAMARKDAVDAKGAKAA